MSKRKLLLEQAPAAAEAMDCGATSVLRERAYANLVEKLVFGELPLKGIVSEQSLAAEFGMSRTPVREAIRRLVHEGVVEQLPRYGTRVREISRRELSELYELREALEPFAAAKVAGQLSEVELERLEGLVAEVRCAQEQLQSRSEAALGGAALSRFLSVDLSFHLLLLQAAGNERLLEIVSQTRLLTRIFFARRQPHDAEVLGETHRFHHAVLDAIRRGDGLAAAALMRDHVLASKRRALEYFDQRETASISAAPRRIGRLI